MKSHFAAAAIMLILGVPAFAQSKPVLPTGSWGYMNSLPNSVPKCTPKPFLIIAEKSITINMTDGKGHCKIKSVKMVRGAIDGRFDCVWDKKIPPEELVNNDGNEDEFGIEIKSKDRILYNNVLHGRCDVSSGGAQ